MNTEPGLVNCAQCRRQLYGERAMAAIRRGDPVPVTPVRTFELGGRVAGRPYCATCLPKAEGVAWSQPQMTS